MNSVHRALLGMGISVLAVAVMCMVLIIERLYSAAVNYWKFSGNQNIQGIDLGANSSLVFISICMFGIAISALLYFVSAKRDAVLAGKFALIAGTTYVISGFILFGLVSSGLAFLYCGR